LEKAHLSTIITQKGALCGPKKDYTASEGGSSLRERKREMNKQGTKGSVRKIKDWVDRAGTGERI
jgi:hypothetical protein